MRTKFLVIVAVLATAILCLSAVSAEAAACPPGDIACQIEVLLNQIRDLQAQIAQLQAQQNVIPPVTWCHTFNTNLGFANSGSTEVGELKTALIKNGVWPYEAVTYDYDEETVTYVIKFQAKYGITPATGYVGVSTRAKLNALYGCGITAQPSLAITPVNLVRGQRYTFNGTVTNALANSRVYLYIKSPDGTMQENGRIVGATNSSGSYSVATTQAIYSGAQTGAYVVWVTVGGAKSNEVIFSVSSATQPSITVTSPNGGESITAGTSYDITWTSGGVDSNLPVSITLIDDDRNTTQEIESYFSKIGDGKLTWSHVPAHTFYTGPASLLVGNKFRIRICVATKDIATSYCDYSNYTFSIVAQGTPSITVLSPNGGENYPSATKTINFSGTANYVPGRLVAYLDLKTNSGDANVATVNVSSPSSVGSFSGAISGDPGIGAGQYKIKVCDLSIIPNPSAPKVPLCDSSDNYFSIVAAGTPSITVTSPNGGEIFRQTLAGQTTINSIDWTGGPFSSVQVFLASSSCTINDCPIVGEIWRGISSLNHIGWDGYTICKDFDLPSGNECSHIQPGNYKIYILGNLPAVNGVSQFSRDVSDNYFSIVAASACKNEGESIPVIANPPVCCSGLTLIRPRAANIVGSAGICTARCGNGVCDSATETNYNCSADCPSIQPSITVTSPNGGEVWKVGDKARITWTSQGLPQTSNPYESLVSIYKNNILVYTNIYSVNDGFEEITVPSTIGTGDDYSVDVFYTTVSGILYKDRSDGYFSIVGQATTTCTDSDGGKDYNVKGYLNSILNDGSSYYKTDFCYGANYVQEWYCDGVNPRVEYYLCPNGCDSATGACKSSTSYIVSQDALASISAALQRIAQQIQQMYGR